MLTISKKLKRFTQLCSSAILKSYFKTDCSMNALMEKVKSRSIVKNKIKACQLIGSAFVYLAIFQFVNVNFINEVDPF